MDKNVKGSLLSELRRRNIFRVAGVYAVAGWLLAQMAAVLENSLNMPSWFDTVVVSLLLIGFPIAMILAWAFETTPDGIKRTESVAGDASITQTTGRKLDYVLIGGLALVGMLIVGDRLMPKATIVPNASVTKTIDAFTGQSIAVLPFEDFSPDKDQAYFADGIAEELLNVLARVEGLRVASRTSAFSYKGREASIAEIGEALNVAHILEGSVRKAGDTLRITAQLIDTKTDVHMWSETYDRPLTAENIFQIQDEISKAIVLELNGRLDLLPETGERATQSTEALEAYLKGKESYGSRNAIDIEFGITELIRAVTIDPDFAVAHAKLARAYTLATVYGDLERLNAYPRAKIHIERAEAIAPRDWEVLSEYAWYLEAIRDNVGGENVSVDDVITAFDAAIAANSNNAEAHRGKGYVLSQIGQNEAARVSLERAKDLNPRESLILLNLGGIAQQEGDLEALKALNVEAVRITPESLQNWGNLGGAYRSLGNVETAHRIYQSCQTENFCASNLGALHLELGIDVVAPRLLGGDYALFIKAYLAGDVDAFAELVPTLQSAPLSVKLNMYALVGRWDEGYKFIQDNPVVLEGLMQETSITNAEVIDQKISLLETLQHENDPRAQSLRGSLSMAYQDIVPVKSALPASYVNGARWRMLNDDPEGAMVWLNALADLNQSVLVTKYATFDPLKSRADYQAFVASMESYRVRDRALIEAQLANPPEVWWSPEEVLGDSNE